MRVLVVNAGSRSLKVSLVGPDDEVSFEQTFEAPGGRLDGARLEGAIHAMGEVDAVGHRVVHGGPRYPESVRIDADVIRYLVTITDLAPLHLPASLSAMAAGRLEGLLGAHLVLRADQADLQRARPRVDDQNPHRVTSVAWAAGFIPAAALFFWSVASLGESFWKSNPREDEQARRRRRPADAINRSHPARACAQKEPSGSFS